MNFNQASCVLKDCTKREDGNYVEWLKNGQRIAVGYFDTDDGEIAVTYGSCSITFNYIGTEAYELRKCGKTIGDQV